MPDNGKRELPPLQSVEGRSWRKRRMAGWAAGFVLLAAIGAGVYRYGRPVLQEHSGLLEQWPRLQQSVTATGQRLDVAEDKLRAWAGDWEGHKERLATLEQKVQHNLQVARKQTEAMAAQIQQRIAELDRRNQATQARLERVESGQETEGARLARMQEELAAVRRELSEQIVAARQDSGRELAGLEGRLVNLDQQASRSRGQLDSLAHRLDRRRVDFELARNRSRELAPGISLTITRTNPSFRRFDGYLWLLPDRRAVWVRDQSVLRPVIFYSKKDARPHELVVTQVTKLGVAGYMLAPGQPDRSAGSGEITSGAEQ